jgi:hypothetical protein
VVLGCQPSGNRIHLVLKLCLDRSSDNGGIVSVAGYIATEEQWREIEPKWDKEWANWQAAPRLQMLKGFHMSKLARLIGNEQSALCISVFRRLIEESQLQAVGAAVYEPDWRRPVWGHDSTPRLSSPYQQALDMALQVAAKVALWRYPGHGIAVICCEDDGRARITNTYERNRNRCDLFHCLTINYANRFTGLDCADLGAGILRQSWGKIFRDHNIIDIFGNLPTGAGTAPATAFWSLRQASVIRRALNFAGAAPGLPS